MRKDDDDDDDDDGDDNHHHGGDDDDYDDDDGYKDIDMSRSHLVEINIPRYCIVRVDSTPAILHSAVCTSVNYPVYILISSRGLDLAFLYSWLSLGCSPLMFPEDPNERSAMGSGGVIAIVCPSY